MTDASGIARGPPGSRAGKFALRSNSAAGASRKGRFEVRLFAHKGLGVSHRHGSRVHERDANVSLRAHVRRRGAAARSHVGSRATLLAPWQRPIGVGRPTVAVRPVGIVNSGPKVLNRGDHGPCDPTFWDHPRGEKRLVAAAETTP